MCALLWCRMMQVQAARLVARHNVIPQGTEEHLGWSLAFRVHHDSTRRPRKGKSGRREEGSDLFGPIPLQASNDFNLFRPTVLVWALLLLLQLGLNLRKSILRLAGFGLTNDNPLLRPVDELFRRCNAIVHGGQLDTGPWLSSTPLANARK